MSFQITVRNLPSIAKYWQPVVYIGIKYYAPGGYVPVGAPTWTVPASMGNGTICNVRVIAFKSAANNYAIIEKRTKLNVTIRDNADVIYDWAADILYGTEEVKPEFRDLTVSYRKG